MSHQPPQEVVDAAQAAERKWGVPASISIAQWALESGWGSHMPPDSNNPFGIKALAGQPAVNVPTKEHDPVKGWVTINAPFRKFDSLAEAFDLHARLLATAGVYAKARGYAKQPDRFADQLTGTYATDPNYGTLLHAIMHGSNLYQYDLAVTA